MPEKLTYNSQWELIVKFIQINKKSLSVFLDAFF